jgi:putative endonuclease
LRAIRGLKARLNGFSSELKAKRYLENKGLSFIEKNYRCKWGEIDLIFRESEQLVFVEVKSRESESHGSAGDYYTKSKHQKLTRSIMTYLADNGFNPETTNFRIDVIAITANDLEWVKSVYL